MQLLLIKLNQQKLPQINSYFKLQNITKIALNIEWGYSSAKQLVGVFEGQRGYHPPN